MMNTTTVVEPEKVGSSFFFFLLLLFNKSLNEKKKLLLAFNTILAIGAVPRRTSRWPGIPLALFKCRNRSVCRLRTDPVQTC